MADKKSPTKKPVAKKAKASKKPEKGFILLMGMMHAIKQKSEENVRVKEISLNPKDNEEIKAYMKKNKDEDYREFCRGKFINGNIEIIVDETLDEGEMSFTCGRMQEEKEDEKLSKSDCLKMLIYEWIFVILFVFLLVTDFRDLLTKFSGREYWSVLWNGLWVVLWAWMLTRKVDKISSVEKNMYKNINIK